MSPELFIVSCILIVLLVVGGSMAAIFQNRYNNCRSSPNTWCYSDWNCSDEKGDPFIVNSLTGPGAGPNKTSKGLIYDCSPIDQARADALNANTNPVTLNIYPGHLYPLCNPNSKVPDTTNCPKYQAGDIDWTTCIGAIGFSPTA